MFIFYLPKVSYAPSNILFPMKKSVPLVLVEFIEAFAWINSFHLSIIIVSQQLFFTKPTVGHHHHHRRRETEHEIHWTVSPQQRHDRFHYETCVVTYLKSFFLVFQKKAWNYWNFHLLFNPCSSFVLQGLEVGCCCSGGDATVSFFLSPAASKWLYNGYMKAT